MPFMVAALTNPLDFERLVVISVVPLNVGATVGKTTGLPTTLTLLGTLKNSLLNGPFGKVLGTIARGFSSPIKMVFILPSNLRTKLNGSPPQNLLHGLAGDSEKFRHVLKRQSTTIQFHSQPVLFSLCGHVGILQHFR